MCPTPNREVLCITTITLSNDIILAMFSAILLRSSNWTQLPSASRNGLAQVISLNGTCYGIQNGHIGDAGWFEGSILFASTIIHLCSHRIDVLGVQHRVGVGCEGRGVARLVGTISVGAGTAVTVYILNAGAG